MNKSISRKGMYVLLGICLANLMWGLEISSIPAILPTIENVMDADFKQLQWVMNAYTIAVTTVLMAVGTLADRFGRKRIFLWSIAAFGFSSLICGLSSDITTLIFARVLQGASGGAILICQIAVLSHEFQEGEDRAIAWGWWGITFGIGLGFGPIVGGGITAISSWHWVFLINVPLAVIAYMLTYIGVNESKDPESQHLDYAGILTLSLAVFLFTFYIIQGPELGFQSNIGLALIGGALLSFIVFLIVENLIERPMFDFSVFKNRSFSGAIVGAAAMNFSFWPFMIYLPIWFSSGLQYDSLGTGLAILSYTLPTLFMPPFSEKLSLKYSPKLVIPAGLLTLGLGFLLLRWGSSVNNPDWLSMLPGCLVSGIGLGIANTPVSNTTTGSVAKERSGMASGIDMSVRIISLAINIALMGFILTKGIAARLSEVLPNIGTQQLERFAATIAAGNEARMPITDTIAQDALKQGFDWVILYGATCVCLMAIVSFVIFNIPTSLLARNLSSR